MNHKIGSNGESKIHLEPFLYTDIDEVLSWLPTPGFMLEVQQKDPKDINLREFFESRITEGNIGITSNLMFKALETVNHEIVGHCELKNIDEVNRSAELSHVVVGPTEMRGLGVDSKIIQAMLRIGFDVLHLHRLYVKLLRFDKRSINRYEKNGFHREGVLVDSFKHQDEFWDMLQLSILNSIWQKNN